MSENRVPGSPASIGGGNGNDYVPGMAAYTYGNEGRLVVFKLGALIDGENVVSPVRG